MKLTALLLCLCLLLPVVHATEPKDEKEDVLSALFESDILTAREALDQGQITCVELTQYFLDRIEIYNDTYNCFITLCDNALEEAAKRDALLSQGSEHNMLLGIPIVVKDNIAYEGYPTTNGLYQFGSVSWTNATIVQTLLDAGAVILGKSNMSTEAQEAQFTASDAVGETFNAYGTELSAGGSSGGSAAAVSLNFCYAGLGTDTNASLRYPAVLNGCIALRPTRGLLDREGIEILNGTRDVPGVITRSVTDQALVLGEMTGIDYYNALTGNAFEGMRIGILSELCYSDISYSYRPESKIDQEIKATFFDAVDRIRDLGATVIQVSIPNIFTLAERCEYNSSSAISSYADVYETMFSDRDLDAVIFPTYLHTPDNSLNVKGWDALNYDTFYSNCSLLSSPLGVPEIAIPIGYHSKGSGIGLEIAALKGQEELLLNLAYSYTEHFDTRKVPENAPDLYLSSGPIPDFVPVEESLSSEEPTEVPETVAETISETTMAESVTMEESTGTIPSAVPPTEEPQRTVSKILLLPLILLFVLSFLYGFGDKVRKRKKEGIK